jgi:hypothetical protein
MLVFWTPLVTEDKRPAWEEYAMANRFITDEAYDEEAKFSMWQDEEFQVTNISDRMLQLTSPEDTILDDGTGYHSSIWSVGAFTPRGDEANGTGPYLPLWQRR